MDDELKGEYAFDFSKAKPNRFAAKLEKGGRLIILAPDIAATFTSDAAVNDALRELVKSRTAQSTQTP